MKSIKCSNCGLINFETQTACKRCGFSFSGNGAENNYSSSLSTQNFAFSTNRNTIVMSETEDVKGDAWKKIKWGSAIAFVGFAITFGAVGLGFFEGYSNTDKEYLGFAKVLSFITLLPLAAVFAGVVELVTGVSIFKIIEKWEELPQWLGWLIGISLFLLIITVIMVVAAVVIFNFF